MATNTVKYFNPSENPSLAPTYCQISTVDISETKRLINFAGQTGTGTDLEANKKMTFEEQNRIALKRVDQLLAAVGASKKDIVMCRAYVVKLTSMSKEDNGIRGNVFLEWWRSTEGDRLPPPDTLIGVDSLWSKETAIEYEMQCVADKV